MKILKNILFMLLLSVLVLFFSYCNPSQKKADSISAGLNKLKHNCFFTVIQAGDAGEIGTAIENCTTGIRKFITKAQKIKKKELDSVKDLLVKITLIIKEFENPGSSFSKKLEKFNTNPAIAKARKDLLTALAELKTSLQKQK